MTMNFNRLLCLFGMLCLAVSVFAQEPDIRYMKGEKFVAHEVKAGETLWAIAQRYNSTVADITASNPGAENGLSIGQTLMISFDRDTKKELKNDPPRIENGDVLHTAKKGETLFSLYKRYNVEVNDLIVANPQLDQGLKVGMVVRIPMEKVRVQDELSVIPAVEDGSTGHEVLQGETIYSISKLYGITEAELLEANGGLPEGLKKGAFVRIPDKIKEAVEATANNQLVPGIKKSEYRIAYLLPFLLDENDTLMAKSAANGSMEFRSETEAALHFYYGSKLALGSAQKAGLNAEVFVREMNDEPIKVLQQLDDKNLQNIDLYIGPFHRNALDLVLQKAAKNEAHVVCPTKQSNKAVLGHPELSTVISTGNAQIPFLANEIAKRHYKDNIIIMEAPVWKEADMRDQLKYALENDLSKYLARLDSALVESSKLRSCEIDKNLSTNLLKLLDPEKVNVLVVPTNEVYHASELMTRLSKIDDEVRVVVYGLQSWNDFDNIDADYKDRFELHTPTERFVDLEDEATRAFIEAFRQKHGTEPNQYAFLGYDISLFHLSGLAQFGVGYQQYFDQIQADPLHMEFEMKKAGPQNGYINEHLFLIDYKGFHLNKSVQ